MNCKHPCPINGVCVFAFQLTDIVTGCSYRLYACLCCTALYSLLHGYDICLCRLLAWHACRAQLATNENTLSHFKHDLHGVVQELLNGEKLAAGMQKLKEAYALQDTSSTKPNEVCDRSTAMLAGMLCMQMGFLSGWRFVM